jgi:Tol biopolymer transport system component
MKRFLLLLLVALSVDSAPSGPELVGEGTISTRDDETGFAITPDKRTAFFVKQTPTTAGQPLDVICVTHFRNGHWSEPEVAPFSGQYRDITPAVSPDGSKLFFASNRPSGPSSSGDFQLYVVDLAGGWKTPKKLDGPVNGSGQVYGVSVASSGTLYFGSNRAGGSGSFDIYRSRLVNGVYQEPENLGLAINTEAPELMPAISPDEKTLVFTALGRADEITGIHKEYNKGDLYVSYFQNAAWTAARNAGPLVNSGAAESAPFFSSDGSSLFFVSERGFATLRQSQRLSYSELNRKLSGTLNGLGNIYRVDARLLAR